MSQPGRCALFMSLCMAVALAGCTTRTPIANGSLLTQKPLAAPEKMEKTETGVIIPPIHFGLDSSELSSEAKKIIGQAIDTMKAQPKLYATLQGHTCSNGSPEHNRALSGQRAAIVMKYMVDGGIAADRLGAVSMGPGSPVAPNTTEAQKALNRRVEIHLYTWKDAKPAKGKH